MRARNGTSSAPQGSELALIIAPQSAPKSRENWGNRPTANSAATRPAPPAGAAPVRRCRQGRWPRGWPLPFPPERYGTRSPPPPYFRGPPAGSASHRNQLVDQRGRDSRRIRPPQLPLFPQQPRHLVPVGAQQRFIHEPRDLGDPFKVPEYSLVAVDVCFEHFPIVDARLPGRAGVGQHESRLYFLRSDRH